jgi:hypothetical protein
MKMKKYLSEGKIDYKGDALKDLPFFRSLTHDEKVIMIFAIKKMGDYAGVYPDMDTLPYFNADFVLSCVLGSRRYLNPSGQEIVGSLIDKFEAEGIV